AGAIDDDVRRAVALQHLGGEAFDRRGIRHVDVDVVGVVAGGAQLGGGLGPTGFIDVGQDHAGAGLRIGLRGGAADAGCGAGNEGGAVVEFHEGCAPE